jgi:ATP-dependent DNA helicase RecG
LLTVNQVIEFIRGGESAQLEFKESASSAAIEKIAKTICAYSNDLAAHGGSSHVVIGVDDDGQITGTVGDDQELQRLANIRSDGKMTPLPTIIVDVVSIENKKIIVVEVSPSSSPPVRYGGVAYVRVGTTTTKASVDDERRLDEHRRQRNLPYDVRGIEGSSQEDLDLPRFKLAYLPQAVSSDVLTENGRPIMHQLTSLKLTDSNNWATPTGLLTIGINPRSHISGAYVQFRRANGRAITDDTLDQMEFSGTLDTMVKGIEEKLSAHNSITLALTGNKHLQSELFPMRALIQLVRNAIMHRDYQMTAPVRVTWFSDRIEISNPGAPFEIPAADFGREGLTGYRNPNIAEAMKNLGLAERFGIGISTARKALAENGNPPLELRTEGNFSLAIIRAAE